MTDVHTREQRSRNMSAIKCKDTSPEKVVRSLIFKMGFRYRLHRTDLPGKPDIVLLSRKKVVEVHGCFWHMHKCRFGKVTPATRASFWAQKRLGTVARDRRNQRLLRRQGWRVCTIWECMTRDQKKLEAKLRSFLE